MRANFFSGLQVCTPSWYTLEGEIAKKQMPEEEVAFGKKISAWGAGPIDFQERLEAYASNGSLEGFTIEVVN